MGNWGAIYDLRSTRPEAVLTFDDGPDPDVTEELVRLLADTGSTATFFMLLTAAKRNPSLVKLVATGGHDVALHGADHRPVTGRHRGQLTAELAQAAADLSRLADAPVHFFRPPYGALDLSAWLAIRAAGLDTVMWSSTTWDWKDVSPDERLAKAETGARPGAIVLAHDGAAGWADRVRPDAATAVDKVGLIRDVHSMYASRGLRLVSVSRALVGASAGRRPPSLRRRRRAT